MWILLAFASAFFAGLTSILAKCGIKRTPSETATAIRTGVVLAFAWIMVFIVGSQSTITDISVKSWVFLILSGLATGGSWLCYFRALSIGDVNKVVPIDKSSTVLTMLLAFILFPDTEKLTAVKAVAMVLIAVGTYMMIEKKKQEAKKRQSVVQIKEIKVRPKTDDHDYETKLRHIRRFLEDGDRCKVTVFFRGREIVHKDRGISILERVVQDLADVAKVDQEPRAEGRTLQMLLVPKK